MSQNKLGHAHAENQLSQPHTCPNQYHQRKHMKSSHARYLYASCCCTSMLLNKWNNQKLQGRTPKTNQICKLPHTVQSNQFLHVNHGLANLLVAYTPQGNHLDSCQRTPHERLDSTNQIANLQNACRTRPVVALDEHFVKLKREIVASFRVPLHHWCLKLLRPQFLLPHCVLGCVYRSHLSLSHSNNLELDAQFCHKCNMFCLYLCHFVCLQFGSARFVCHLLVGILFGSIARSQDSVCHLVVANLCLLMIET